MPEPAPARVVFVTGNTGKLAEVQQCLAGVQCLHLDSMPIDLVEIQASTVHEVSRAKALQAYREVNKGLEDGPLCPSGVAVLVEDTSLGFMALNGLPGPYVKWFLENLAPTGLVRLLAGFDNSRDNQHLRAKASCVFSYCYGVNESTGEPLLKQFEGVCEGLIVPEPRGSMGFGWDSIFAPDAQRIPNELTFAQMTAAEKNSISHRGAALALLKAYFHDADGTA